MNTVHSQSRKLCRPLLKVDHLWLILKAIRSESFAQIHP